MEQIRTFNLGDAELSCTIRGEGPLVICAHGFPDDERSFRAQIDPLVARGYRVVCPTMRGYAPSSVSLRGKYDAAALARDLVGIADQLSPNEKVRLVGHDWGAIAGYAAAALAPERFSHLVTMAVPHLATVLPRLVRPAQLRRSWYIYFFQLPGLAERRLAENELALIDRLWRDWSPSYHPAKEDLDHIKAAIRPRIEHVIGYYRAFFAPSSLIGEPRRLLLQKTRVPTLYFHGVEDGCIGVDLMDGMERNFLSGIEMHRVPGAGHFVHLERPDVVNPILLDFLAR
ncbi:MAG TPA: alpha/beta hydrolase [Myxococcaceae bacterium]|nr:alpha/beta hydrolase [Myxococcaceae bacterium]